jgi:hypothetical protein
LPHLRVKDIVEKASVNDLTEDRVPEVLGKTGGFPRTTPQYPKKGGDSPRDEQGDVKSDGNWETMWSLPISGVTSFSSYHTHLIPKDREICCVGTMSIVESSL